MFTDHYFETEKDISIHYYDEGKGQPVLFIPGWIFSGDVFQKQIAYFSKDYRVIAIDPRGHGKSTQTPIGLDHITHAKDIIKLCQNLSLDNVILCGWSYGAFETWAVIREWGIEHVKGLFNIDQPPQGFPEFPEDWVEGDAKHTAQIIQDVRTKEGLARVIPMMVRNYMLEKKLTEEDYQFIEGTATMPYYLAVAEYAIGQSGDFREEVKIADACPTCHSEFMVAKRWNGAAESYMKTLAPNMKIHTLGCHMMFWDYAEEFNEIFAEFLQQC